MSNAHADKPDQFVANFARHQRTIYAYVRTLTRLPQDADEVFQDVTVVLWRKRDEFEPGTSFLSWACRVAYFEVLAFMKRQRRDAVRFDDELLSELAEQAAERAEQATDRLAALRQCLAQLPTAKRELVERRYQPGVSVHQLAGETGRSTNALSVTLHKIRRALLACIERRLAEGESR